MLNIYIYIYIFTTQKVQNTKLIKYGSYPD